MRMTIRHSDARRTEDVPVPQFRGSILFTNFLERFGSVYTRFKTMEPRNHGTERGTHTCSKPQAITIYAVKFSEHLNGGTH
jgi:hypothetical protein